MGFEVFFSSAFKKELKRIAKKHRQILKNINQLIDDLAENPALGTDLGQNVIKFALLFRARQKENLVVQGLSLTSGLLMNR